MITNERQYRITKTEIERFEKSLSQPVGQEEDLHPELQLAMREGLMSQLQEFREEIEEYDALRSGKVTSFEFNTLADVPIGLINARIARGLTQKQLADSLHLKEQQIQRYESTLYEGAGLTRIQEVADLLGLHESVKLEISES